jgi:alanine racemase
LSYSIEEIAGILSADLSDGDSMEVDHLLIDSRRLIEPSSSLFFALSGSNHDGHHYIAECAQRGVRAFVVERKIEGVEGVRWLVVKDVKAALQLLAAYHRDSFQHPLIAITGSNGKTIVKEWMYQLLSDRFRIVRSPRSYNSQVGVPLSLWQLNDRFDLGLIEAGISKPGEMAKLTEMIQANFGLITNIGDAHSANFDSIEQKLEEKLKLFEHCDTIFYYRDHELIHEKITATYGSKNLISWSKEEGADLRLLSYELNEPSTLSIEHEGQTIEFEVPFADEASVENLMHCLNVALYFECPIEGLIQNALRLAAVNMRMELSRGQNRCTLINDSYNADLPSIINGIEWLSRQGQHSVKTVILSALEGEIQNAKSIYPKIDQVMKERGIERFIGIGFLPDDQIFSMPQTHYYLDTREFISAHHLLKFEDEAILIKGTRNFNFEEVAKTLQEQNHSTVLEIDLNNLVRNLEVYRSVLKKETKVMAMVKASSYGSGGVEVAQKLENSGVDYLAVAYADEGVELRKAGISMPIVVLNPENRSFNSLIKHRLEPEIYSLEMLREFTYSLQHNLLAEEMPFPIHINLDTGMHRLGFVEEELEELLVFLNSKQELEVKSVFTHLSSADDPNEDGFTKKQLEDFNHFSEIIEAGIGQLVLRHALNTAGIEHYPEFQYDMVRLGIGLYGEGHSEAFQKKLRPVGTLKARVLQIKKITSGESVGYSRSFKAEDAKRIATVALGYADGLPRALGNGKGSLIWKGKSLPILGNVCMDMCMVDVTGLDCHVGDEMEFFGHNQSLSSIADQLETISYEVLSSIPGRVKRTYVQE